MKFLSDLCLLRPKNSSLVTRYLSLFTPHSLLPAAPCRAGSSRRSLLTRQSLGHGGWRRGMWLSLPRGIHCGGSVAYSTGVTSDRPPLVLDLERQKGSPAGAGQAGER